MQISSTHNLPVSVGNHLPQPQHARRDLPASRHSTDIPQVPITQRARPATQVYPDVHPSMTQRGEQARRLYHEVAVSGEIAQTKAGAEAMLVNRLDVFV